MTDFKDHEKTAKEYNIGKGGFWRFDVGDNRFRLLTGYEPYGSHWVKADGRSYICIGKDKGKWYVIVDNEFKEFVGDEKDIEWKLVKK